jgi:hypothetical protein
MSLLVHTTSFHKLFLAIAIVLDLLAGGFACYVGADPLVPFLAYTLGVAALYMERLWLLAAFISLGLSLYGTAVLRGETFPLLIAAAVLKCAFPFLKGRLVLKSEVLGLVSIMRYLKENPQALFVLPFMLLLGLAAVKQVVGDLVMADKLTVYAYYQLVGAVAVVLVLMIREGVGPSGTKR